MRQIRNKRNALLHEIEKSKDKNKNYNSEILSRKLEALDLEYPNTFSSLSLSPSLSSLFLLFALLLALSPLFFFFLKEKKHQMRYDVAICQAVSAAATSLALNARNFCLFSDPKDCRNWFWQIMHVGFLFQVLLKLL